MDKLIARRVSINGARVNKLGRCDALLCQKPVQMLSSVDMLAVNNTLTLLGSQVNHFYAKKTQKNKISGKSAVGDVSSHPEMMAKRSSPSETLSGNSRNNGVE